jgi:membrane protein DedA with SNARE-associated domain
MDIITWGVTVLEDFIAAIGYLGIFLLMTLESMALPIPSEVVMTFAGALAFQGRLDIWGVTLAGTIGCTVGSVLAYAIGMYGGRSFICRYGRYVLLRPGHIDAAEQWFKKYGNLAVFGSRLLPVVRTFISLPAGMAKMNFPRFVLLSFAGSLPWCFMLAYLGYYLGGNWQVIQTYFGLFTIIVVVAVAALLIWYFLIRKHGKTPSTSTACPPEKK